MSSAVFRSVRNQGQAKQRATAVLAVLLVLVSTVALMLLPAQGSPDYTDDDFYVTYHPGSAAVSGNNNASPAGGQYGSVVIRYDGVPVAEYNPQFWSDNISGISQTSVTDWYPINSYVEGSTVVFTGWMMSDSQGNATGTEPIDPGEDLTSLADSDNTVHLVATWDTLYDVRYVDGDRGGIYLSREDGYTEDEATDLDTALNGYNVWHVSIDGIDDSQGKYRSIILLCGSSGSIGTTTVSKSVTIRSLNLNDVRTLSFDTWTMGAEAIIDNVRLNGGGSSTTQDHSGIFANCNRLILGTGIVCAESNGDYVQAVGGYYSGSTDCESTDLRIFSGTFSNVIGGGGANGDGSDGYYGTIDQSNVTILGTASVIESVIGGSVNAETTATRILVAGHADIRTHGQNDDGTIRGNFSTVIGGSRYGTVGETNVVVAGQAKLFAVQGGGRQASSHADVTNVTICGNAEVSIVVGSVTDGNPRYDTPVGQSNVNVRGSPTIGSLYGGGWDIWASPTNPSTERISITVEGSPVIGNVFGGGFRGSVGTQGTDGSTVEIRISGGSVANLFGGGSGGEDPVYDINQSGNVVYGDGRTDTTGPALVYGDVSIEVTGGTVGAVYGGGQGAARLSGDYSPIKCARVYGDVSIRVSGDAVVGSVYGGGMGIDADPEVAGISGSISILIDGAQVGIDGAGGDVYGGGMYSEVDGDGVSISATGSRIEGSVYGGGMGSASDNELGSVTSSEVAIVIGSGTEVGGDVYGGGMYGLLESDGVAMSLVGTGTTIGGDVYGGGLGTENRLSTVVSDRTIVINGPTILGSVYGGSRDGDDNYASSGSYDTCETRIYVLSGTISEGASGNVYGGAYRGRSRMDVGIYVGSAVPEQIGTPVARTFSIHSIFGGASVGEVSDTYDTSTVLLYGDAHIAIGGAGYEGRVSGDVFGAGDYCDISGTSSITFEHFEQTGSMLSIQKADLVELHDTEITVDGDVDGNSTSGSAKLSINDVGRLVLYGDCTSEGRSGLTLNAQVSALSGYESVHVGGFTSDGSYVTGVMNYLRLNGGKMFSVLGPSNDGTGMAGTSTSGATLLLRDDNTYYGALAISGPSVDSTAEFVLEDGTVAGRTSYDYSSDVEVTVWYLAGAFTVDETMNLVSGTGLDTAVIGIPKMVEGSEIRYVGHYTSMSSEGSLNVVEDTPSGSDGTDFQVILGTGTGAIKYQDGKGLNIASADGSVAFEGSGASIGITVCTDTSFNRTGYAGTIHIHMVEVYGGITIGTFDIEVAVFLTIPQPAGETFGINQSLLVKDYGENRHRGETDVYLPVLDGGAVGTYTLVSVEGIPSYEGSLGDLSMSLASTYLNKSGWLSVSWTEQSLENVHYDTILGDGGLHSPVLHFDFTCPGHDDPDDETQWAPITVVVRVEWTQNGQSNYQDYTITLTPQHASERTVALYDKWLANDGGDSTWEYPVDESGARVPSFTLSMEFGDSILGLYVAIDLDSLKAATFTDWEDYIERFQMFLLMDANGYVVTGSSLTDGVFSDAEGYEIVPVYLPDSSIDVPRDLLSWYQHMKSGIAGFSIDHDYLRNVRWFDNPDGPAQFNFYSQVTEVGLSLYAGYGVIITLLPEVSGDAIGSEQPWVSPSTLFLEDIERPVTFNDLRDSLRVTEGYEITAFLDQSGTDIGASSMLVLNDIVVRVVLEAETYSLFVEVVDEDGDVISDGISVYYDQTLHYGDDVTVTIAYTGAQQYRILGAEGRYGSFTLSGFTFTQAEDNSHSVCGFTMPSGDVSLTITLAEGYTLTVTLPESDPRTDDNALFGLSNGDGVSVGASGGDSVEIDIGLNGTFSVRFTGPTDYGGRDVTVTIGSCTGAAAELADGIMRLTGITGDVTVELRVNIEWRLAIEGEGYSVQRGGVALDEGSTVHTGDVLTLVTDDGYEFDEYPMVTGATVTGTAPTRVTMSVSGTGDVTIAGDATRHTYGLTVVVDFGSDVATIPGGALTVDGEPVELSTVEGRVQGTVQVTSGDHHLELSLEGCIRYGVTVDVLSDTEVTMYAVPQLEDSTEPSGVPQDAVLFLYLPQTGADGTHQVTGLDGASGTFSNGSLTVTVDGSSVILDGFSHVVGTVIVDIGNGSLLVVEVLPATAAAGGSQIT